MPPAQQPIEGDPRVAGQRRIIAQGGLSIAQQQAPNSIAGNQRPFHAAACPQQAA